MVLWGPCVAACRGTAYLSSPHRDDGNMQGYSLDFAEPTQMEDPAALFATLRMMVSDEAYHPDSQAQRAAEIRAQKSLEVRELLMSHGQELHYWQFRHRLWLARKYAPPPRA